MPLAFNDPMSPRHASRLPHDFDHEHGDVSGGWLRAATFGAMDGLVSNTALIAGVGAAADAHTVILGGFAGLAAGAFSMALGEYTSVQTANEQIQSEVHVERRAIRKFPEAEANELIQSLQEIGLSAETAAQATAEIHRDVDTAVNVHLIQEIGIDPEETPSPYVAAISSFLTFSVGALIPLIPYLLGFEMLWLGLASGALGLVVVGAVTSRFTGKSFWFASGRQLLFGLVAVAATYAVGILVGEVVT